MATTYYHTVDGEIIGETTNGVRINYATDALGSVTGTLVGGQLQNTYAYKPYGALLAKTGTGADPKHGWNGSSGYRPTGRAQSDYYVRARHYGSVPGMWTSVDPLWSPRAGAYAYARSNPTASFDYFGRRPDDIGPNEPGVRYGRGYKNRCKDSISSKYSGAPWFSKLVIDCKDDRDCEVFYKAISDLCSGGGQLDAYLQCIEKNCLATGQNQGSGEAQGKMVRGYISDFCAGKQNLVINCPGRTGPYYDDGTCGATKDGVINMVDRPSHGESGCPLWFCTILHELIHVPWPHAQHEVPPAIGSGGIVQADYCYFEGPRQACLCFNCSSNFKLCQKTRNYFDKATGKWYGWNDCSRLESDW